MKIKTVKKLNLHELIKHVWDNEVYPSYWRIEEYPSEGRTIQFFDDGRFRSYTGFHESDIFTVEVEGELTEDTEIHGATLVYYNELKREIKSFRYAVTSTSLKRILRPRSDVVALAVFRGKQLIWTKEHGIPESGVLEVSE